MCYSSELPTYIEHHIPTDGHDKFSDAASPKTQNKWRDPIRCTEQNHDEGARECCHDDTIYAYKNHHKQVEYTQIETKFRPELYLFK